MTDVSHLALPSAETVGVFMDTLERQRSNTPADDWRAFLKTSPVIRSWRFFLSLDPYTRWGLVKPRGYPGDATLMDFAYGHESIKGHIAESGSMGAQIYAATSSAKQSQSARERIEMLRSEMQNLASTRRCAVVSFAAGHARELENMAPMAVQAISSFTAIDIDPLSLREAQRSAGSIPFLPVRRNVIKDPVDDLSDAGLVYSLGLFDYLTDEHAVAVLGKMLRITSPGGKCIVANLSHDAANLGYCEAIMDWWMVTRSSDDMLRLGHRAGALAQRPFDVSVRSLGCFHYLELNSR